MSIRRASYSDVLEECARLAQNGQRLRPGQSPLAAFDADGTLWAADVAEVLWARLVDNKALHPRAAAPMARALRSCGKEPARDPYEDFGQLMNLYRSGGCPEETMVRAMLEGLVGLAEKDLLDHCGAAVAETKGFETHESAGVARMIAELRRLGFRVIVVSGSPRWAVECAVRRFGVEPADVLAGQVAVVDGVLTDGIIEPLPYGPGKIQAILRRLGTVPQVAVGNTLGDLAMLEATSHLKLIVNASQALAKACEQSRGYTWSLGLQEWLTTGPAKPGGRRGASRLKSASATAAGGTSTPTDRPRRPGARP